MATKKEIVDESFKIIEKQKALIGELNVDSFKKGMELIDKEIKIYSLEKDNRALRGEILNIKKDRIAIFIIASVLLLLLILK